MSSFPSISGRAFLLLAALACIVLPAGTASAVTYQYLETLGTAGTGVGQFNQPSGVVTVLRSNALDPPTTHIFVADTLNNRIQRSINGGTSWTVVAPAGIGVGAVNAPQGVAYDELNDKLYVADTGNNRIQRADNAGASGWAALTSPGVNLGQTNAPRGVSSSLNDTLIFVADTGNNRIQRSINGGGSWTSIAAAGTGLGQVNQPSGVAYDEFNDILYVADTSNNRIQRSLDNGNGPWQSLMTLGVGVGSVTSPRGIAVLDGGVVGVSGQSILFVADTGNNRIQVSMDSGVNWSVLAGSGTAPGSVNGPRGLYADPDSGKLYVADTLNNRVQVFAPVPEPAAALLAALGAGVLACARWRNSRSVQRTSN